MPKKFRSFSATEDDVAPSVEVERLEVDYIVVHQFVGGARGRIAWLHET